jgi:hypothetical protein
MSDSNATITRTELLQRAFRRIGIDSPSTNELALAVPVLNDIMRELDPECRFLHAISNTPTSLTLANGTASYSAGSGASNFPLYTMAIERVELRINSPPYVPLAVLSRDDWFNSIYRGTSGQPLQCHLERAAASANSLLWFAPTPDAAYTANVFTRRMLYDFDNASDNPDIPQSWNLKLIKRLAYELAPENGIPLEERQLIKAEVDEAMALGKAAEADSTTKRPVKFRGQYF